MLLRVILAFLALPGVIAFAVPLLIGLGLKSQLQVGVFGMLLLLCGLASLAWCVWAFYVSGKGTLAPWSPPENLVTHGLYRCSRNPMYCGVVLILTAWAVLFQSVALAAYAVAVAVGFHLRVVHGEEPWLERTHGQKWLAYKGRVSRWFGWPWHGSE